MSAQPEECQMQGKIGAATIAVAFGNLLAMGAAHANNYVYTQVQITGSQFACAVGINDSNNVIGEYYGQGNAPFGGYLYYPKGGTQTLFNAPGTTSIVDSCAYVLGISDISTRNLAVATYGDSVHHRLEPFTFNPGTGKTKKLPFLFRVSVPTAVNKSGVVTGTGDKDFPLAGHGFVISGGVAQQFDPPNSTRTVPTDIADDGTIVGYYNVGGAVHGFVRAPNGSFTTVDVPGSTDTEILSINYNGKLAGKYYDGTVEHYVGFVKSGTHIAKYQYPGAGNTEILRALPTGLRIGNYEDSSSVFHGFSFLPNVYTTLTPPSVAAMSIRDVNSLGNFVGNVGDATSGTAYVAICPPNAGTCSN
jgi:hypothetical protein